MKTVYFLPPPVNLGTISDSQGRFEHLITPMNPQRLNLRDSCVTLVKFGLLVDTRNDEYQRILQLKISNKDVLYESRKIYQNRKCRYEQVGEVTCRP